MAVLDHHGVVEHGHVGHAAVAVAGVEIGAEHRILLGGRRRRAHVADNVGVALGDAAHVARGRKIGRHHAHRHAGTAGFAGRPVGDRLAAAEAAMGEQVVELARAFAHQMREHLALFLARPDRGRAMAPSDKIAGCRGNAGSRNQAVIAYCGILAQVSRAVRPSSNRGGAHACTQHGGAPRIVDDDRAEHDIVQQPAAFVEKTYQQD